MKNRIVALDFDNCLFHPAGWYANMEKALGRPINFDGIRTWRLEPEVAPHELSIAHAARTVESYRHAVPAPESRQAVALLNHKYHLVVVTSDTAKYAAVKRWLLSLYFPYLRDKLVLARDKRTVLYDALVDDAPHNEPTILYDQPWNRSSEHRMRAHSWLAVPPLLKSYFNE